MNITEELNKKTIYEKIKDSLLAKDFVNFKTLVKKHEKDIEYFKQSIYNKDNIFEKQINDWISLYISRKYLDAVKYLLQFNVNTKTIFYEQLKISIDNEDFKKFKFIINNLKNEIDIDEFKQNTYNKEHAFEKQIDRWISFYFNNSNIVAIKFLLQFKNNIKESLVKELKASTSIEKFIFVINNFKNKIDVEELRKIISNNNVFEKKIEKKLNRLYIKTKPTDKQINLLISIFGNEYIYKYLKKVFFKEHDFAKFQFFIKYINIEQFKKTLTKEEKVKLDSLDKWIKESDKQIYMIDDVEQNNMQDYPYDPH